MNLIKLICLNLALSAFSIGLHAQKKLGVTVEATQKIKFVNPQIVNAQIVNQTELSPSIEAQNRADKLAKQVTNLSVEQKKKAVNIFYKEYTDVNLNSANINKTTFTESALKSILTDTQMKEYKNAEIAERKLRLQRVMERKPDIKVEK